MWRGVDRTNTMTNNESVIDLTHDESLLVDHCALATRLANSVIILEDSPMRNVSNTFQNQISKRSSIKSREKSEQKKTTLPRPNNKNDTKKLSDCPICFEELGVNPLASTKCGHVFCLECLVQALKGEKRCPTCRCVLKGPSGYHPLYL